MGLRNDIHDLTEKHCKGCAIRTAIFQKFGQEKQNEYCIRHCPVGVGLSRIGVELEHGVKVMVGEDLTEERYERMSKDLTDREICRRYGISVSTLGRRKKRWKAEGRFYRLENFTPEQYHDLKALRHTDVEIAKMQGVGRTTLIKWKRENGVYSESVVERLLRTKTKADYYDMIAQGYDDSGIGKKWNASAKSVLRWRYKVGLYSNPRI